MLTNRKRRKSSSPIYDAVSSIKEHEQVNILLATLVACEVITRMLLGRIFQGHTCGGPSYLDMCAPEWFVFLLVLPRWRVFFLGSSALHYAGTDRLQMVGYWFLSPRPRLACSALPPTAFEIIHDWE